jgi:hypothetical protein
MPRISPASSQIEVVIVAAVVTFAAVRAFKKVRLATTSNRVLY